MSSDHWYSEVFRALPDLVCHVLPGLAASAGDTAIAAANGANATADSLPSSSPRSSTLPRSRSSSGSSSEPETKAEPETTYIFRPVALKKVTHHPDGVLWPR